MMKYIIGIILAWSMTILVATQFNTEIERQMAARVPTLSLPTPNRPIARRLLVIGIDGVRSDALKKANTPHIDRLTKLAYFSMTGSIQKSADSISGPGWASVLTGVEPTKHGIWANQDYGSINRKFPSFMCRLKRAGFRTSASVNWKPIVTLMDADCLDRVYKGTDAGVTRRMSRILRKRQSDAHFVHIDGPDHAGHHTGFSLRSRKYIASIERADNYVGQMIAAINQRTDAAREEWMVVITTDHGGYGKGHRARRKEVREVPLVIASPALEPRDIGQHANHMDVAPTILHFMAVTVGREETFAGVSHWINGPRFHGEKELFVADKGAQLDELRRTVLPSAVANGAAVDRQ